MTTHARTHARTLAQGTAVSQALEARRVVVTAMRHATTPTAQAQARAALKALDAGQPNQARTHAARSHIADGRHGAGIPLADARNSECVVAVNTLGVHWCHTHGQRSAICEDTTTA